MSQPRAIIEVEGTPCFLVSARNGKWRWVCGSCGSTSNQAVDPPTDLETPFIVSYVSNLAHDHIKRHGCK